MPKASTTTQALKKYSEYLSRNGLKSTVQRDIIINEFLRVKGHLSVDELHSRLKLTHSSIGLATVYRTLKILSEAGLAHERQFQDGFTRYEYTGPGDVHHDHIVCVSCGHVEEFENRQIEELQKQEADRHHFKMLDHKFEIYGICKECQEKEQE
ncbi:MAG: transcriptional repressor [Nitrospinota bacterium]|nr:transcriptional repressor [Nitrospinota bacterium]MDH5679142.1 transcriptional repressor [Nitrospinota bacterium]MDH5756711.1 transcriptional repressor [Nitrospinota bacterium]